MLSRLAFTRAMHTLLIAASLMVSWDSLYAQCPLAHQPTDAWVVVQSGDVSMMKDTSGYRKPLVPCSFVSQQQVIKTGQFGVAERRETTGDRRQQERECDRRTGARPPRHGESLGAVHQQIQHGRMQDGLIAERLTGRRRAGENENSGADHRANTHGGEAPRS